MERRKAAAAEVRAPRHFHRSGGAPRRSRRGYKAPRRRRGGSGCRGTCAVKWDYPPARAARDFKANVIVDPYLVQVTISADGEPVPVHYRERMRTLGPTTRLDLGKQAEA